MNRCKTCKHWNSIGPYFPASQFSLGQFEWGNCVRLEENDCLEGSVQDENAADEYVSREDFGCVLHEEK